MTISRGLLSHVTPWSTARVEVLIATIEGAIGASEHLVAQLASNEGLRGQNTSLVLPGSSGLFGSTSRVMMERCSAAALIGRSHRTEASHGCIHLELIRLGAAEHGRLLALKELLCLFAILLFGVSVDQRTLAMVIDFLLNHLLLFLLISKVRLPIAGHPHTVKR